MHKGCVEHQVTPWSTSATAPSEQSSSDWIAKECAVALVYNGISHTVMMASPMDLSAFAIGFSFSEGIVDQLSDIYDIQINTHSEGMEVALTLSNQCFMRLKHKRRSLSGRTGCGICGVQSLQQLQPIITSVEGRFFISHTVIDKAVKQLHSYQSLQALTGAVHGAAWCDNQANIIKVCEDVGRHNALDKLIGTLIDTNEHSQVGFLLISSRASYEIVQKAARASMAIVVAVSAPTSLAIAVAEQSGLTLVGFSRADRHVVYTHGHRIK